MPVNDDEESAPGPIDAADGSETTELLSIEACEALLRAARELALEDPVRARLTSVAVRLARDDKRLRKHRRRAQRRALRPIAVAASAPTVTPRTRIAGARVAATVDWLLVVVFVVAVLGSLVVILRQCGSD